jgi:peptidoglycan/LPS O-acetylase OafA/YrhL
MPNVDTLKTASHRLQEVDVLRGFAAFWVVLTHYIPHWNEGWLALLFALDFAPYFALGVVFFDAMKHSWSPSRVGLIGLAIVAEFLLRSWTGVSVAAVILLLFFSATHGYLRFLVSKLTLWLGAIYSLYLIHRNLGY